MIETLGKIDEPEKSISLLINAGDETCLHFEVDHLQYYASNKTIRLGVLCYINKNECRISISSTPISLNKQVLENIDASSTISKRGASSQQGTRARNNYHHLIKTLNLPDIDLYQPLKLDPISIAKNWGKEIWYTGIEKRGVCCIQSLPLPWLLDVLGGIFTGQESSMPILLKILDPFPEPVYGDLYFELHTRKREVYIVTHIDVQAWPKGVGKIRYGFNKDLRSKYPDDETFKKDYLNAVEKYQQVRRQIDAHLDKKIDKKIDKKLNRKADTKTDKQLGERKEVPFSGRQGPVPIAEQEEWKAQLDNEILEQEQVLRTRMDAFTSEYDLQVGDVIEVHPGTPHSLQHGVRVIEFQTPHYERKILSATQKVLTQDHWDTAEALNNLKIREQLPNILARNRETGPCVIADFDEFSVTRLKIAPGENSTIDGSRYYLIIGIEGHVSANRHPIGAEEGLYIGALAQPIDIVNHSTSDAILLIARPK